MKRKIHLICNAHIDPIWQWEWEEGASATLSTFQSATNLLKDFDYIFNHNEVSIYKYTEQFAPELFKDIQYHVDKGDWNIMGGWYLQPDCLMPSGEGIIRQIQEGKMYFTSKFGKWSKTAINFDAFGHSRGIVQIVKKCGQENYVCVRPYNDFADASRGLQLKLPSEQFIWEGYDGSTIKAIRSPVYGSALGDSKNKILRDISHYPNYEHVFAPWGVGNHGGGPSRKDLADLKELIETSKDDVFFHSTPDEFFDCINPKDVFSGSLLQSMPGCYTSIISLKQAYRSLEKNLFFTEKLCSSSAINCNLTYPEKELHEVVEALMNVQFHDVLPGSCVKSGEECAMNFINHGQHILNQVRAKAFFEMIKGEKVAEEETYPIFVFNPKPYEDSQLVEAEMCLVLPNNFDHSNDYAVIDIFDEDGNQIPCQNIKEESTISWQWRKRVIFSAKLKPLNITRFTAKWHIEKQASIIRPFNQDISFKNDVKEVFISKDTGLISSYKVNGIEYATGNLFEPYMYEDYEDPWGMVYRNIGWKEKPFKLMKDMRGVFANCKSIEVVEDGNIFLGVESFFELEDSRIRIFYRIYKTGDMIDVDVDVFPGDINKAYKLHLPLKGNEFSGEEMFGYERLYENNEECMAHNYLALKQVDGNYIEVMTPTTFGSSYKDGVMKITLLRSATYCAHPSWLPKIVPDNTYIKKVDSGKRSFSFRLTISKEKDFKKNAEIFLEKPYALNCFPTIDKKTNQNVPIFIDNPEIHLATMKKGQQVDGYIIRLENNFSATNNASFNIGGNKINLSFGKYEVKTIIFDGKSLKEIDEMKI